MSRCFVRPNKLNCTVLNLAENSNGLTAEGLCLACGLCCNGVIFADVKLQPNDDPVRLRSCGLPISRDQSGNGTPRFTQPCAALDGCRCQIYPDRPKYCREFECALLKRVKGGKLGVVAALRTIGVARGKADRVRRLLGRLGDTDEKLALSLRFQRTAKRLEQVGLDEETADGYGRLTLAVHDLTFLLAAAFHPGR